MMTFLITQIEININAIFKRSNIHILECIGKSIIHHKFSFSFSFPADFAPDELEVSVREHILQDLEGFVRRQFSGDENFFSSKCNSSRPDYNVTLSLDTNDISPSSSAGARLRLFGSSKNGFGFRQSDLDICMVLDGQDTMDVSFVYSITLTYSNVKFQL